MDFHDWFCCLVECALPQLGERREGIAQSTDSKPLAGDVENGYLLADGCSETAVALVCSEDAFVGNHPGTDAKLRKVEREEEDVADGVVLAKAGSPEVCYVGKSFGYAVARGFGEVVIFLLFYLREYFGIALPQVGGDGVAVADDGVRLTAGSH